MLRDRRQLRLPIIYGIAGMGWGMTLIRLLALVAPILGISAPAKYLASGWQ